MTIEHLRGGVALIGTAAELATANPVLLQRQLSLETDTGVQKIGDGTTHYNSLSAVPGGGGGSGGAAPLQASAHLSGSPIAGGYQSCVDLVNDGTSQQNIVSGCLVPWTYEAGHRFRLEIDVPTFMVGSLAIDYAELNVASPDGANAIAVGLDTPLTLTSGQQIEAMTFDNAAEADRQGSDLTPADPFTAVVTAAGGVFVVSYFVQFSVSGLLA